MNGYKLVITKSTVPVGTNFKVKNTIANVLKNRGANTPFDICSNPEFLREGCAIEDALKPNRVVIGVESDKAAQMMTRLYEPFLKSGNPMIVMDPVSSEMTKYAANSMLATKISLMNEFSRLCEKVGADIEQVRRGIGSDHRIGPHFIYAGVGYGGSCFPKDVQALIRTGDENKESLEILKAVEEVNQRQRRRFSDRIFTKLQNDFKGKKVAVWGVAFKPGTDDIREAPALDLIENFLKAGATVTAYDPVAAENTVQYFANPGLVGADVTAAAKSSLTFKNDQYDTLQDADILVIVTEWKSFREPDFNKMKGLMKKSLIFDGRNIYQPSWVREQGFEYHSIGRQ